MILEAKVGCNSATAHQVSHPDLLSDMQPGKGPSSLLERGKRNKRGVQGLKGRGRVIVTTLSDAASCLQAKGFFQNYFSLMHRCLSPESLVSSLQFRKLLFPLINVVWQAGPFITELGVGAAVCIPFLLTESPSQPPNPLWISRSSI